LVPEDSKCNKSQLVGPGGIRVQEESDSWSQRNLNAGRVSYLVPEEFKSRKRQLVGPRGIQMQEEITSSSQRSSRSSVNASSELLKK
jgi:hypothetical protein